MIIKASTPEDFREALLVWFRNRHADAARHSREPNLAPDTRMMWQARLTTLRGAIEWLEKLEINSDVAPGMYVIDPPEADNQHTGARRDD